MNFILIKLAQTSDLHLDSPLASIGTLSSSARRSRLLLTFEEAVAAMAVRGAQVVLMPGDLFDRNEVSPATADTVLRALGKQPDVHFFIAPGNHDTISPRSPYLYEDWPENVHIFKSAAITYFDIDALNLRVYGRAGQTYDQTNALQGFRAEETGRLNLMVLHGLVTGGAAELYCPISPDQIAASGLTYLALGHVHSYSGVQTAGATCYAYSGVLEGRGFDETGEKGFLLGEVGPGLVNLTFVPFGRARFEWVRADITGCRTAGEVLERIAAASALVPPKAILRVTLLGTTDGELELDCAALAQSIPFSEVQVVDQAVYQPPLAALAAEQNLVGFYARRMLERMDRAAPQEQEELLEACRIGLSALSGRSVLNHEV